MLPYEDNPSFMSRPHVIIEFTILSVLPKVLSSSEVIQI